MFGDYNNLIVNVLDSISKWFTDLSCKTSEVLDGYGCDTSPKNRAKQALFIMLGAFFILLYGLYGIVKGFLSLALSLFRRGDASNYIRHKELFGVFTICAVLFLFPFLLSTNDYAKNINIYYYNNRKSINETCRDNLIPVNSYYNNSYLYNLRNALECTRTSPDVSNLRKQLDDDLPKELHFATVNDYLIMLLSLRQFDILDRCACLSYFSDYSNKDNAKLFQYYLSKNCKEAFMYGQFYTSDRCLELKLRFANYNSITDDPHFNNSFYLMRLFNENIMDRYLSSHQNNRLLSKIVSDVYNIDEVFEDFDFEVPISRHESDIIDYLSNVYVFNQHHATHTYPTEQFLHLYANTESNILKQYSLNMALRSQYEHTSWLWNQDGVGVNHNLKVLNDINIKCTKEITFPYLLNTLNLYNMDF